MSFKNIVKVIQSSRQKKISYKKRKQTRVYNPLEFHEKNLDPRVVLHFAKNNIFFNIMSRLKKDPFLLATFFWLSCGSQKFSTPQYKGSSKTSYIANYSLGLLVAQKLTFLKFRTKFTIAFKGFGKYFSVFLRALKTNYRFRFSLLDLTPISLNGCRLKKVRRV